MEKRRQILELCARHLVYNLTCQVQRFLKVCNNEFRIYWQCSMLFYRLVNWESKTRFFCAANWALQIHSYTENWA